MAASEVNENAIPSELKEKLTAFDTSLSEMETVIRPWLEVPENELHEKLSPLDKAKLDLVGAYTINSLFWMYLNVCGEKPKEHAVKQELDRIRSYMTKVKDVQDKLTIMPKIDKDAAKRFQRNALWQAAKQAADSVEGSTSTGEQSKKTASPASSSSDVIIVSGPSAKKRKRGDDKGSEGMATGERHEEKPRKKKKKKKDKHNN